MAGTERRPPSAGTGRPAMPPSGPPPEQRWPNQSYWQSGPGGTPRKSASGCGMSTLVTLIGIVMIAVAVFALVGAAIRSNNYVDPAYVDITPYYNGENGATPATAPFPGTNPLASVGPLNTPRVNHTATLLPVVRS